MSQAMENKFKNVKIPDSCVLEDEKLEWCLEELTRLYKDRAALWNKLDSVRRFVENEIKTHGEYKYTGDQNVDGYLEGLEKVLNKL